MSTNENVSKTKICPTCGTRLGESASKCLVCGATFEMPGKTAQTKKSVQGSTMPKITLSLPAALGFLAFFLIVGAGAVYFGLQQTGQVIPPTDIPTPTVTVTVTPTATATLTPTLVPTPTPQPPFDYTVASGDTCGGIAVAFGVSVQSIIILNNLPASCNSLVIGQALKIPYPTPTVTPFPTATLEGIAATEAACEKVLITVQENDTLSSIAANYAVPQEAVKAFNGLSTDTVFLGMQIQIPLCMRAATPGPTPTPTTPPPYPAPNLLLPADGASFTLADDVVTLQWASIGVIRDNEVYQVTVEDVTEGEGRRLIEYVTDTKFIVPVTFRPEDNLPHVMRWNVTTVRQAGTDEQGEPIWESAGALSKERVFSWTGAAPEATQAP
ncbi:MAG: LysM peptidoglycan-binding domain-containing protein [Anaerolineae bacterium]|jgi:LysM repeat protein|nr:LysM peptidoglycan-binding domain-containing protein [Anaerolineae bacterium]MBT7072686.1 LysM peptidoglycan-binding domain-containing protein [Anaerolineae bacterium]MBT7326867.1 LysM peptidoglycan-binding domain-containing protein [Anaerolineae bacterium]